MWMLQSFLRPLRLFSIFTPALAILILAGGPAAWADAFGDALRQQLQLGAGAIDSEQDEQNLVTLGRFYAVNEYVPLWVEEGGVNDRGKALAKVLAESDLDGLDPGRLRRLGGGRPAGGDGGRVSGRARGQA